MANRILRCTQYQTPFEKHPTTIVTRECDLAKPIEQARDEMERVTPEAFVISEVFEVDDRTYSDIARAVHAGIFRLEDSARQKVEHDQALSFYWNVGQMPHVSDLGVLINSRAAPLTVDQLMVVMRQLARHPKNRHFTFIMVSSDYTMVRLDRNGIFSINSMNG